LCQPLVGTLHVVLALKRIEVPLLRTAAPADRLDRLAFERTVHALVGAVVLRTSRATSLMDDP
jgi:hypothetical protein